MLRNKRVSELERKSIIKEYINNGYSFIELGRRYNISPSTVYRFLKEDGVTEVKRKVKRLTKEDKVNIYNDFVNNNIKINELVRIYNSSHYKINKAIKDGVHNAKQIELENRSKDDFGLPKIDGVEIYKTERAWGDYMNNQYKILKWIKGEQRRING